MGFKLKSIWTNRNFLTVLSIVLAVGAWLYIIVVQNPELDQSFKGLPITPSSNETLLAKELVVVDAHKMKMNVTVRGSRRAISLLQNSSFNAWIDVSHINAPGTYTLPVNVSVNDASVGIIDKKPYYLDFLVDHYTEVYKDVEILTAGDVKAGYAMRGITVSPNRVLLKGPQSIVNTVSRVTVSVDLENVGGGSTQDLKYKLLDKNGAEVSNANIVKVADTVSVNLDVAQYTAMPFQVDLKNPEHLNYMIKDVKISPESIRVFSSGDAAEALSSIYLGAFPVDPGARSIAVPVKLPGGVEAVDKFTTVTVEYQLEEAEKPVQLQDGE